MHFRQASNWCKRVLRVLEAAKLSYANKAKESISSQKLGPQEGKPAILSLFSRPEVLSSASNTAKMCLEKTFLKTLILMTQVSLYSFTCLSF